MKKPLAALAALSLSAAVSACSMHNGNGNMSAASQQNDWQKKEWNHKEHMRMMAQDMFNAMDANGDGVVTRKEFNDYSRRWFKEADTENDGRLTFEEFEAKLKQDKEQFKSEHHRHSPDADNDRGERYQDNGNRVNNDRSYNDNGYGQPEGNQGYNAQQQDNGGSQANSSNRY